MERRSAVEETVWLGEVMSHFSLIDGSCDSLPQAEDRLMRPKAGLIAKEYGRHFQKSVCMPYTIRETLRYDLSTNHSRSQ
jgi:hypothetical protein